MLLNGTNLGGFKLVLLKIMALQILLKMRLVTGSFEIVYWLYTNGPTNSRDLARQIKVSPANFQIILRRLREDSLVLIETDDADKRGRRYSLAPEVWDQMKALDIKAVPQVD